MELLREGILAFFAAVGVLTVVWLAAGALLREDRPVIPGLLFLLPVRGDAPTLEQDVRELRRFLYQLPSSRLILADSGLTEDARKLAAYLAEREDGVTLMNAADVRVT